jgi:hypothetical protein
MAQSEKFRILSIKNHKPKFKSASVATIEKDLEYSI